MRNVRGSMLDVAGVRPGGLARAQRSVVEASLPDPRQPKRTPLPLVPVARTMALQSLVKQLVTTQTAQAMHAAAALPALLLDPDAMRQAMAMVNAVAQQWMSLQAQWIQGLTELGQDMGRIRETNTVSKFVDQEFNFVQQAIDLVSDQATATVRLWENTQIDVAWWLSQRANDPVTADSRSP